MKVVALISGGKDSCFNMLQCVAEGHDVVALVNLRPRDKDELDSYMYQTVGHQAVDLYAEAIGLPLYRRVIEGESRELGEDYTPTSGDEVEDLYCVLKQVKEELKIEAVSVGAILSNYQRVRVENVCERLGLTSLAYLWRRDQDELLQEMIACGISAVLIKVAGLGLYPEKHLGKSLKEIYSHMVKMNEQYGLNICGEGGEYETFTLDCPLFNKRIVIDETERVIQSADDVGHLNLTRTHLEDKDIDPGVPLRDRLKGLPMRRGADIVSELGLGDTEEGQGHARPDITPTQQEFLEDMNVVTQTREDGQFWICGVHARQSGGSDIEQQTREAMEQLNASVRLCAAELSDLVAVYLYVRSMEDFTAINTVYKQTFHPHHPVRVCVQVGLPANMSLQIDCYGWRCDKHEPAAKCHTMHVQGLSHWAPANIGPYSQSVKVGNRIYVAGQIPLCPASGQVVAGGVTTQAALSLRHVTRVLEAMDTGGRLQRALLAVCYVTNAAHIRPALAVWQSALDKESEETAEVRPMVAGVVVPVLPRGALVEWQVYARAGTAPTSEDRPYMYNEVCETCKTLTVTLKYFHEPGCHLACLGFVRQTDSEMGAFDVINCIFRAYRSVLDRVGGAFRDLPTIRMFYSTSHFSHEILYKEIRAYCDAHLEKSLVPFSLIPVLELSSPDYALMFCH